MVDENNGSLGAPSDGLSPPVEPTSCLAGFATSIPSASERAAIVEWLRADDKGRGLVAYRHCWNIAAMIERGDHIKPENQFLGIMGETK